LKSCIDIDVIDGVFVVGVDCNIQKIVEIKKTDTIKIGVLIRLSP
jgi:hypothetical protein